MSRYVLDANALMAFFEERSGSATVEKLLQGATVQRLLMSVINWGEVYYSLWRIRGRETANEKLAGISQLPIDVIDVDPTTTKMAAIFKAETGLPYADAFAAALTEQSQATLVTGDRDFARVELRLRILWLEQR